MQGTLVLGGTGFLGAWVAAAAHVAARRLATFAEPQGEGVWAAGRRPAEAPRFSDPRDGVRWETLDLEAQPAEELESWLDARAPRVVLSCASLTRVDQCEAEPGRAGWLNRDVPGWVAGWCARSGARLVHVSTDMVFGSRAPEGGFDVDAEPQPLSVYGQTKLEGEHAVLGACPGALVVRLPLLYGNSGGRGLGASDGLLQAVDRGERPGMFVDEWRTPLEVSNAADALLELAEGEASGVLHLAGPDRISRYDLALGVLRAMGLPETEAAACVRPMPREQAPEELWRLRAADASLNASAAQRVLATELLGVRAGLRRAVN